MAPSNSVYFIQAEVSLLMTAMKWGGRLGPKNAPDEEREPLFRSLSQLRDILNNISDLRELDPMVLVVPFLEVIRSEETTGPITGLALTAVDKLLGYGLIDTELETAGPAIEAIADAVTHARFVGTEPGSDEVVLMKILHVLRTLLLVPVGSLLSNEAVCEIMQSCFRICFESRLSELLRKTAEYALMNMVQLLFTRLPHLREDSNYPSSVVKKLKMRKGGMESTRLRRKKGSTIPQVSSASKLSSTASSTSGGSTASASSSMANTTAGAGTTTPAFTVGKAKSSTTASTARGGRNGSAVVAAAEISDQVSGSGESEAAGLTPSEATTPAGTTTIHQLASTPDIAGSAGSESRVVGLTLDEAASMTESTSEDSGLMRSETNTTAASSTSDYTNPRGVRFTSDPAVGSDPSSTTPGTGQQQPGSAGHSADTGSGNQTTKGSSQSTFSSSSAGGAAGNNNSSTPSSRIPYGMPCVRELFRFLVSLITPEGNPDTMIHMGLSLLTVALESGADNLPVNKLLLDMVKDDMTKNLMTLLNSERLSLFAASLRVCFLLFESTRSHLKFQLEMYLTRLMEIITSESEKISFEQREIALESIVQLWRIPGFVTELYLNYDCDLFCSNLFEDLSSVLSKNVSFPPVSRLVSTHILSLDALLAVIDTIEQHCNSRAVRIADHKAALTSSSQEETTTAEAFSSVSSSTGAADSGNDPSVAAGTTNEPAPSATPAQAPRPSFLPLLPPQLASSATASVSSSGVGSRPCSRRGPSIRPNRMPVSDQIPTKEQLAAAKHKKKLLLNGTEKFNHKPKDGVAYLQTHGLLSHPLDPAEVAQLLREDPRLDKRMIGDYISAKSNASILEAFVRSFTFEDVRLDEALRQYLESFRLPGEAPLIQHVLEHFAEVWHRTNGDPFANTDATFTLSYAVVMLNTDQHNPNSKKQNTPMNVEDFRKNVKGINGGDDFDPELLEEIYWAIHNEEIVMPSEQAGSVRENYLWKILLRRGLSDQGRFMHAATGTFDVALFELIWGPTMAALSSIFDKTTDANTHQKVIAGFRKCAMISAHYGLSDVFDNMVISLCKFTTLLNQSESPEQLPTSFGRNTKAQLACRTVFQLAFRHSDILREGWKHLLDCLAQLYRARLLPDQLMETEDFVHPEGKVRLPREAGTSSLLGGAGGGAGGGNNTGMLSSFYLYFTSSDSGSSRGPSQEEVAARQRSCEVIRECHIDQLLEDSKFLQDASLTELVRALILATKGDAIQDSLPGLFTDDEESRVFSLELLIRVLLQNRDRMQPNLWPYVHVYMYAAMIISPQPTFLLERCVVGLLRLAIRLLRKQEMTEEVFSCLKLLMLMKPNLLATVCRQIVYGLHHLLHTHAANIPAPEHWQLLFSLLEVCGASTIPSAHYKAQLASQLAPIPEHLASLVLIGPPQQPYTAAGNAGTTSASGTSHGHHGAAEAASSAAQSDSELPPQRQQDAGSGSTNGGGSEPGGQSRGYTSDSELRYEGGRKRASPVAAPGGWILVDKDATAAPSEEAASVGTEEDPDSATSRRTSLTTTPAPVVHLFSSEGLPPVNPFSIVLQLQFRHKDARSLIKACETLAFLVRDPAHITPSNFGPCVHALRVFVEACLHGGRQGQRRSHRYHHQLAHSQSMAGVSATSAASTGGSKKQRARASAQQQTHHSSDMSDSRGGGGGGMSDHDSGSVGPSGANVGGSRAGPGGSNSSGGGGRSGVGGGKTFAMKRSRSIPHNAGTGEAGDADQESDSDHETGYHNVSIQHQERMRKIILVLLDLLHTLHTRAASIYTEWSRKSVPTPNPATPNATSPPSDQSSTTGSVSNSTGSSAPPTPAQLWEECWCPLLQGMARLCCDSRRVVRQQAVTYLQRALLAPDLHSLTANEWEACFTKVLFPLLSSLLEPVAPLDPAGMEETRMRASTLLSKVFLQHLNPLFSLPTFVALWLTILDFIDKYMHANNSDLLIEAVPESLKNMLLVMDTADILRGDLHHPSQLLSTHIASGSFSAEGIETDGDGQMWKLTWDRISEFLPDLKEELFPEPVKPPSPPPIRKQEQPTAATCEPPIGTESAASQEVTGGKTTEPPCDAGETVIVKHEESERPAEETPTPAPIVAATNSLIQPPPYSCLPLGSVSILMPDDDEDAEEEREDNHEPAADVSLSSQEMNGEDSMAVDDSSSLHKCD